MAVTSSSRGRIRLSTIVIGIGNLLLRDEGAGIHAIRALRERYSFPEGLELLDGGTMGLDLLPRIEGRERLLIVDAANFNEPPGTVKVMEGDAIRKFLDTKFSVHQIGLPDMLFASELQGSLPPEVCIIGIQPDKIETGLELTGTLRENFDTLIDTVIRKLRQWGIDVKEAEENVPGNPV